MRKQAFVGAAALAFLTGGTGFVPPARAAEPARAPCCYSNRGYAGVCAVEPGAGESCTTILAYLNTPQSLGKTYCGNTTVRGGWKQRKCAKP